MSSDQAPMEHGGGTHHEQDPVSAKKLWRVVRAVYLVLVKGLGKHQPKLAALGVHLHHMLSKRHNYGGGLAAAREHPALTYLSTLSCRSLDPATAVHPYPRGAHGASGRPGAHRGAPAGASLSSLSCRSMDPAAAVYQYQYRPREVEFSCSSTPLHKRRRAERRLRLQQQQQHGAAGNDRLEYGSAEAVTRLFELMDDVREEDEATDSDLEGATPWAPAVGPAPRQVRITDSPFLAREEDDEEAARGVVDRHADEFIMWFHEQLRMQQHRAAARERSTYWVR